MDPPDKTNLAAKLTSFLNTHPPISPIVKTGEIQGHTASAMDQLVKLRDQGHATELEVKKILDAFPFENVKNIESLFQQALSNTVSLHTTPSVKNENKQTADALQEATTEKFHEVIKSPSPEKWKSKKADYELLSQHGRTKEEVEYYQFLAQRMDAKINSIKEKQHYQKNFGDRLIGSAMNLSQKPPIDFKFREVHQAKQALRANLIKTILEKHPETQLRELPLSSMQINGICFGVMVDLAENYFKLEHKNVEELFSHYAKGGTLQSEINHAAYSSLIAEPRLDEYLSALFTYIENIKKQPSTFAGTFPPVEPNLVNSIRNEITNLHNLQGDNPLQQVLSVKELSEICLFPKNLEEEKVLQNQSSLANKDLKLLGLRLVLARTFETMNKPNADPNDWFINPNLPNYPKWEKALIDGVNRVFNEKNTPQADQAYLTERRAQLIGAIKLAIASAELQKYQEISDPMLNKLIKNISFLYREHALLESKGLAMVSCIPELGSHLQYSDNYSYLANIDKLKEGFYYVGFHVEGGRHAISFIKQEDGSGYILDPKGMQLKFKDAIEAKELMMRLLTYYPQPNPPVKGHPYHMLEFYKIEKAGKV